MDKTIELPRNSSPEPLHRAGNIPRLRMDVLLNAAFPRRSRTFQAQRKGLVGPWSYRGNTNMGPRGSMG